jgi:hypothetical protein
MNILLSAYFGQKNKFPEDICPKIYFVQDPDPVKNRPDLQHCILGIGEMRGFPT